jgi:hypothetical protein
MEDTRTEGFRSTGAARETTNTTRKDAADTIVSEADRRSISRPTSSVEQVEDEKREASSYLGMVREPTESRDASAPSEEDEAAPLSSALGIPTLVKDKDEPHARQASEAQRDDGDVYFSSRWFPLLSDNPTPLSTALNIPVLLQEARPASKNSQR